MYIVLISIVYLLINILDVIEYVLMGYIILGWIVFFGVVKNRDGLVFKVYVFLMTKIEPLLGIIRRVIPSVGGFDFSPLFVFFALHMAKVIIIQIANVIARAIYG